ncbi:MAG: signal peptidase I [Candidatus Paceibacterota bacterium]
MDAPEQSQREHSFFSELVNVALLAALIVLPIRLFIAQPFIVSGASMDPTFSNGDYLIVDQLSYRIQNPDRGDVIIFRYPRDPSKFFIKRIIGLPGETVTIEGDVTTISGGEHKEPLVLDESFVRHIAHSNLSVELNESEYFVMGDNRRASSDSRVWGPLPRDNIVGRAFLRLLPASQIGILPGDTDPPNTN